MKFITLIRLGLVMLIAGTLAGCGDDGSNGSPGATGAQGPAGPAGPAGQDAVATVAVASNTATPTSASTAAWAALAPQVTVQSVTIASAPVVNFTVKDAAGNPVVGLGNTSQSATATVPSYPNLAFALAKLVPGTSGAPSKWVSYIVTTVPTKNATTGAITASVPTRPSSDNTGTLVDNGNGSYTYTFYRDITKIKDEVAAATLTAPNVAADLGDLTYNANAVHRLVIQLSGNAPGTGSNTPNGVTVTPSVAMENPANAIYDFIPATGPVAATDPSRDIVATAKCNECHGKLALHGGGRVETKYCVVCHTDQRKYGRTEATTTATGFSGSTYRIGGNAVGDFPNYVHKLHMSHHLSKDGYNYANILFNEITYPQDIKNCVKCHDGSATSNAKTANGDNWKNVPNRLVCGACHDGINFATGGGTTLNGEFAGHVGGAKADDSQCALCHDATSIATIYHVTVDPEGSSGRAGYPANTALDTPTPGFPSGQGPTIPLASQLGNLPAGVFKMNFEIKQVTVAGAAGAKKATVVYRILKDGLPVTLNATGFLMNNVDGTPSIYVAYAVTQDGITNPADWNASTNMTVKALRDGALQTGPDADGFYSATLSGTIPDAAKMVTAAIGINYQGFVQLGHPEFPNGIRLREPQFVMKLANGYTARRSIVSNAKCNNCHGQLGVSPSFHGGARNNGEGCAICHNANNATGHTGAANSFGGGWNVGIKNLVHSIHGSAKREQDFSYEATAANPGGFAEVTYPGILKNCETCHVAGAYDFSASANSAALPNLLWTTDAKGDMSNPTLLPSIGLSPWVTINGAGQINYSANNLVTSPIASACFGCHDSSLAVAHMESNGGTIVRLFSSVASTATRPAIGTASTMTFTKTEQCTLCHGSGKVADIKAMHE
ncbi:conserved exported protein of unknown function [Georgfuchsia toluolica]|uniref:Outer membrane cytochrome MtrC/MtrF-like domain-containing protein n=1 Tax=Georgfuchsia toluolica TaxID=424218 RepID=A0A916J2J4_9PROT|nr:OmcA/MtrC family decaheme c-type cytochrome [Georgfuchsia toluolica]CAG4883519.1 conserved exported protein of unknown function [Georgfuchsia toluolica]